LKPGFTAAKPGIKSPEPDQKVIEARNKRADRPNQTSRAKQCVVSLVETGTWLRRAV